MFKIKPYANLANNLITLVFFKIQIYNLFLKSTNFNKNKLNLLC